jgi:uncharacterized protein YutE (UPF0331/DUF86 family)
VTYLSDRLTDLRRHLDHLAELRPRARTADALRRDMSLDNDVRYSLLVVCQRTIDLAAELSSRRRLRFEDYSEAIRNLAIYEEFPDALIRQVEPLADLRNALIHGNGPVEPARVIDALGRMDAVERFVQAVARATGKKR